MNRRTINRLDETALMVCALLALCFLACGNALQCYFVADDFVPLAYMHEGFNGNLAMLFAKLWQPWQDNTVQLLFRPVSEISMWLDYLVWRGQAFGYHLTNILWHAVSTVTLYFLCTVMLHKSHGGAKEEDLLRPSLIAFAAAALFATTPLHTETVAWMIGRVDSICTSFCLLSFLFFAMAPRFKIVSLIFFVLALFSKEMSVTLPAVLTVYTFVFESGGGAHQGLRAGIGQAFRSTATYWVLLIPFFALRTVILGTPFGGYIGSIGDVFAQSIRERFLQCQFSKIFYPFIDNVLKESDLVIRYLHLWYAGIVAILLVRMRWFPWTPATCKILCFTGAWFVISVLPALPLWYLNGALIGARFLYLGTAALSLLLVVLIVPLEEPGTAGKTTPWGVLRILNACVLTGFVVCFCLVSRENNGAWIRSGAEAKAIKNGFEAALKTVPPQKQLVLLNTPRQKNGEHFFYTTAMFQCLLKPPLTREDFSRRVSFLQPNTYIPEDPISVSTVRKMIASGDYEFYCWNVSTKQLQRVELLRRQTHDVDTIEVTVAHPTVRRPERNEKRYLVLSWSGTPRAFDEPCKLVLPLSYDKTKYQFHVSEKRGWILASRPARLDVKLVGPNRPRIISVQALKVQIPELEPVTANLSQRTDSFWVPQSKSPTRVTFDVSNVAGATGAIAELSQPNSFFVHYTRTLRDSRLSAHSSKQIRLQMTRGEISLPLADIAGPHVYQLRIAATDARGNVIGFTSDPLSFDLREETTWSYSR